LVAVVIAGCGTATREGADDSSEAALRRHAVAVRTKPLSLDAMFEGEGGRTSVSWIGPIYPPAPLEFPEMRGLSVRNLEYMRQFGRFLAGASNSATACCGIALGAQHHPAHQAQRPRDSEQERPTPVEMVVRRAKEKRASPYSYPLRITQ
jgi:hypothetical protein